MEKGRKVMVKCEKVRMTHVYTTIVMEKGRQVMQNGRLVIEEIGR